MFIKIIIKKKMEIYFHQAKSVDTLLVLEVFPEKILTFLFAFFLIEGNYFIEIDPYIEF